MTPSKSPGTSTDLGKQLAVDPSDPDWPRQFTFYDTIDDTFVHFVTGTQVWDNWEEFESDLLYSAKNDVFYFPYRTELTVDTVQRFKALCPAWVFAHASEQL